MRSSHNGISQQRKAAKHRLDDARALLKEARWRGAMYLAGYSVECLLKVKLMHMFRCRHLQELGLLSAEATVFTHHLETLLRQTKAINRLRQDAKLWRLFNLVNQWIPAWRYSADLSNSDDATDFLAAVEKISKWIENNI